MKKSKLPNQYEIQGYLEKKLKKYGLSLTQVVPFRNYDKFVFLMNLPERKAYVEIEYNGRGYNLTIHRGEKKVLEYDHRFNMSYEDLREEINIFIKTGE